MEHGEKVAAFGYDPAAKLVFIGTAVALHQGRTSQFDFYYNPSSRKIDVCFAGCNGTYLSGVETSETETTLPAELSRAFFEAKRTH